MSERRLVDDSGVATPVEARSDRSPVDYTEFKELATAVRQWLVLARAKDAVASTPVVRAELRTPHPTVADVRWQDREEVVVTETPALLIDAAHLTSEGLPQLLETVRAAYGSPVICRAYADWTKPDLAAWFEPLRHYGVQPVHNFDTPDHSRSLVALTLEALEIVEKYAVTSLVLVGDFGAALPLVTRLKAAGVKVAVIGPASNPDDVRRDADEFVDIASLSQPAAASRGRHRA
ncbi:NYN domain-containing protein [Nocardioides sp.]|uniref:NYN domain-containing protein n=1 Tax=Nocardioides sp. TaxID=35761 RepID=UPI00286E4FE5|nr:NYN domain-containing protein [Nocardioides sp.]